jgi:hypothetical protein
MKCTRRAPSGRAEPGVGILYTEGRHVLCLGRRSGLTLAILKSVARLPSFRCCSNLRAGGPDTVVQSGRVTVSARSRRGQGHPSSPSRPVKPGRCPSDQEKVSG